ncbi:Fused Flagellar protein FliO/Flagellar biosynthetic protein FliP [Buchnera aphidicola (Pemphigus populi)]
MKNNIMQQVSPILPNLIIEKTLSQVSFTLLQIIALIILLSWVFKKMFLIKSYENNSLIRIISKMSIGSNESILVIDVQDVRLVLGLTRNNITYLHDLTSLKPKIIEKKKSKYMLFPLNSKNFFTLLFKNLYVYRIVFTLFLIFFSPMAYANISDIINDNLYNEGGNWSFAIQVLVLLTSLTFIPAILLMMTSFTRIIIVFGLLRNALGTPYAPSNQILIGLALFLTFFIMSPVYNKIYYEAYLPFSQNKITMEVAIEKGIPPLKEFMINQTRETDLKLFAKLANISSFINKDEIPMCVVLPSFITSELKTAFQIGFTIFIPFLIIDLVVASVLMSLGMMMVPPSTIALPFKLMLFVLVDGWPLLIGSLAQSFFIN